MISFREEDAAAKHSTSNSSESSNDRKAELEHSLSFHQRNLNRRVKNIETGK